jgi:hypothetical protein
MLRGTLVMMWWDWRSSNSRPTTEQATAASSHIPVFRNS